MSNKSVENLILQDPTDNTKKITFDISNQNTLSNQTFTVPLTDSLNNIGANVLVTERSTSPLRNKTLINPVIDIDGVSAGGVTILTDNITTGRTIRFPDADATLLSTENVTFDDVTFGAGISAANLSGRTRQQQFFYAGF